MKRKLLFVATEDWFVRSHFMPMVRRAVADGFDTVIAARMGEARADLIAAGARVVDFGDARGAYDPATITRSVGRLRSVIDAERPDIVHAIALRPILLTALAVRGKRGVGTVFAVTGRGYLAMTRSWPMQRALDIIAGLIARAVRGGTGVLLVENTHDRDWVAGARPLPEARVFLTPGAGVDLTHYSASPPPPPAPPVRIGCVTRLVRSKGVDVLVEAVGHLRASGRDVEAVIAGAPDPDNPSSVSAEELARWRALPAIDLPGRVSDVNAFWAGMHIACLPSRGGEGLPRSLLEAAACARPIVTTNVAGCADFVRDGVDGFIVPPESAEALASALGRLVDDAEARVRLGASARVHVAAGYTEEHAAERAARAWRAAMARS